MRKLLAFMILMSQGIPFYFATRSYSQSLSDMKAGVKTAGSTLGAESESLDAKGPKQMTLFSDGFESGDWSAWNGGELDELAVTTARAASGVNAAVTLHKAGAGSTAWAGAYFEDLMNQAAQQNDITQEFDTYFDPNTTISVSNGGGTKITILICNQDWKSQYPEPLRFRLFT